MEFLNGALVVTQILLATDQDDREVRAEMEDLGDPLFE